MTAAPLLHADADSFFASVVLRSRPELAERPMAVVAHTFIASANYPARERGVRGGWLVQQAVNQCPELVLVDVPRAEVEEAGEALFDLFFASARAVEPGSMEEAFLDVGDGDWNTSMRAARELRRRAAQELGLPVSVGVGRTKLMAKLGSRAAKPDGLHVIGPQREAELRQTLPMKDVWGIGGTTLARLERLGVARLSDLDQLSRTSLQQVCGSGMARKLWRIREGTDDATVRSLQDRSSLSAEVATQGYARRDHTVREMAEICVGRICHRAERGAVAGSGLTLNLRPETEGELAVVLKSPSIPATADLNQWLPMALELLQSHEPPPVAGLKATLTGLVPRDQVQPSLF